MLPSITFLKSNQWVKKKKTLSVGSLGFHWLYLQADIGVSFVFQHLFINRVSFLKDSASLPSIH